mgnify:CR=1 FL=1
MRRLLLENISPLDISSAINDKRCIIINYHYDDGSFSGDRLIEPYVYGTLTSGNEAIRAFQYEGVSKRGVPKWKLFLVDRIQSWNPTRKTFTQEPRKEGLTPFKYNEGDLGFSTIFDRVEFTEEDEIASRQSEIIRRNLEITRKQKERRGVDLMGNKLQADKVQSAVSGPLNTSEKVKEPLKELPKSSEPGKDDGDKMVSGPLDGNTSSDDFKEMLKRNLEITKKEKERRGFDINKRETNESYDRVCELFKKCAF